MPFDGSAWKRGEEDPERLWFERLRVWLDRLLLVMTCAVCTAALSMLVAAAIRGLS